MVSIWEQESFFAPQDVVIVGSGFVGLWSAFYLKKKRPGLKITIVDRGFIPTGASTRNAGFACFGSLSEIVADAQAMGTDRMLELVEMRYKGLGRIRKHFSDEDIDFDLCGGYELYEAADAATLAEQMDYINSLLKPITGIKKTYVPADECIASFGFGRTRHMVYNPLEGYLHAGKLVQALLHKVQGMGVQVFTQTEILSYTRSGDRLELVTNQPVKLSARQLLLCTNAFTRQLLPDIDIIPARGQVLLTSPIEGLPWNGTFHAEEGYYYFRNLGNKVLLGGARNKAFEEEATHEMQPTVLIRAALESYLEEVVLPNYKGQYTIERCWAGIMAMGGEKMPIVKEAEPSVFCAVRMSGMGVALAPVVAKQITTQMMEAL
jgi:glycine/D-amino acid oxidase-like deaminating enzyme